MIIKFIDPKTGNLFDGSSPYVFWFEGQQSTNLHYIQPTFLVSSSSDLTISLSSFSENSVFSLIDNNLILNKVSGGTYDFDLSDLLTKELKLTGTSIKKLLSKSNDDESTEELYYYCFYIHAKSSSANTITDTFEIFGISSGDSFEFEVGADFYNENESLYINLRNKGVEISKKFQQALPETSVHEDGQDNILLNKKFKEFCLEYMNLIGCQGSYKSIKNSIKWLEYNDLINIEEFYKFTNGVRKLYSSSDLQHEVSDLVLSEYTKTNYIGLSIGLQKCIGYKPAKTTSEGLEEPVPRTIDICELGLWNQSVVDLSLKTTLLKSLLSQTFLSVHINLLHASIESLVYGICTKVLTGSILCRNDFIDNFKIASCNIKENEVFYLSNIKTRATNYTPFGITYTEADPATYESLEERFVIGVDAESDTQDISDSDNLQTFGVNYFEGVGANVPFEMSVEEEDGSCICIELFYRDSHNNVEKITTYNINETKTDSTSTVKFNLLLKKEGTYSITTRLVYSSGNDYIRTIRFSVSSDVNNDISVYKVIKKDNSEIQSMMTNLQIYTGPDAIAPIDFYNYLYRLTPQSADVSVYKQYIGCSDKAIKDKINTNQVVAIVLLEGGDPSHVYNFEFDCDVINSTGGVVNKTISVSGTLVDIFETIKTKLPGYYWYKISKHYTFERELGEGYVIFGICKAFTHHSSSVELYKNDFSYFWNNKTYTYQAVVSYNLISNKLEFNNPEEENLKDAFEITSKGNLFTIKFSKAGLSKTVDLTDKISKIHKDVYGLYDILKINKSNDSNIFISERFIPLYYDLVPVDILSENIERDDVICFLPDLARLKSTNTKITNWSFSNYKTSNTKPINLKKITSAFTNDIASPIFGNYEYSILPEPGYYDIELEYYLTGSDEEKKKVSKLNLKISENS